MTHFRMIATGFVLLFFVLSGTAFAADYALADTFPQAASAMFGGLQIRALPAGHLLIWDGESIYMQTMVGGDKFRELATGYTGDPGFMAIAPDGHTVVLGAGLSGKLYRFDVRAPRDYDSGADIATISHYAGAFIAQDLLLIDRLKDDYSTDELAVVDVSVPNPVAVGVIDKPSASDIDGLSGEFAVSTSVAVDNARGLVYTSGVVYDAGFMPIINDLKSISVLAIINAYQAKARLDWNTDATLIGAPGAFYTGGPTAVTSAGHLLLGGFGGVQRVNPFNGTIAETIAPAGFTYYSVAYNPVTDDIMPIVSETDDYNMDIVYVPEGALAAMPAASLLGVLLLGGALAAVAGKRFRR